MNKKIIGISLALMLGIASFGAADAFGFGNRGGEMEMTQERFDEMKAMFSKYTNVADFLVAKKSKIDQNREGNKEKCQESREKITRNVENISNGVRITITSDDADLVEKIQNREGQGDGSEMSRNRNKGQRGEEMRKRKGVNKEGKFAKFRERLMQRFGSNFNQ